MATEYKRKRARKLIKLPSGETIYVPVITEIGFVDSADRGQEHDYTCSNDKTGARTVHVDDVYAVPVDKDGVNTSQAPVDKSGDALKVERIDMWPVLDPVDRAQETQIAFDNKTLGQDQDGNDAAPPHFITHAKTHIYRYFKDPQNPDDTGTWVDSELIDECDVLDLVDRAQETRYSLDNPTNQEFRDGDLSGQANPDDPDITIVDEGAQDPGEGTESNPVRLDPFQNIVNFSVGLWLQINVVDVGGPETDSIEGRNSNIICNGNGDSGRTGQLSQLLVQNDTKLVEGGTDASGQDQGPEKQGSITYPTTWVWRPTQTLPELGPGVFINTGCGPEGGFALTRNGDGNLTGAPGACFGPGTAVGLADAFVSNNPGGDQPNVIKALIAISMSPTVPLGSYFADLLQSLFVAPYISVPFPVRAATGDPGQPGDKMSPASADNERELVSLDISGTGSTIFYAYCTGPGASGGCGEELTAGWRPLSHYEVATAGYNHDDIYLYDNFPVNGKDVAAELLKESVRVKFNQTKSDWQIEAQNPQDPTTTIIATLYDKKDWKQNKAFIHKVTTNTLKFEIKPPLVKKKQDSDPPPLAVTSKAVTASGPKTYKVIVINKGDKQWDIKIEEV